MIQDSMTSELAYMSLEAAPSLSGIEEVQSFVESYQHTAGDEQQSWHITPNSMFPYSLGGTGLNPPSSSTRYQWRELYEAWKLAIPSRDWQRILVFPQKGEPYILQMDWPSLTVRQNENSLSIASTTYISANKSSKASQKATLHRNYALST